MKRTLYPILLHNQLYSNAVQMVCAGVYDGVIRMGI